MLLAVTFLGGLLVMHGGLAPGATDAHPVAMASTHHMMGVVDPGSEPPSGHDVVHLCLTILTAAVVLGLAAWGLRTATVNRVGPAPAPETATPRAPPRRQAMALSCLCVLRT